MGDIGRSNSMASVTLFRLNADFLGARIGRPRKMSRLLDLTRDSNSGL